MKNTIVRLLTFLILIGMIVVPVSAEEPEISSGHPYTNNTELFHMDFAEEGVDYDVYILGNTIAIYDADGSFVTDVQIADTQLRSQVVLNVMKSEIILSPAALVDDYDRWRGWSDAINTVLTFDSQSMTTAIVKASIKAVIQQNGLVIVDAVLNEMVTQIINGDVRVAYIALQYNWNQYCSILRKERGKVGSGYGNAYVYWTSTPWDYTGTVETACRVLTERYPY